MTRRRIALTASTIVAVLACGAAGTTPDDEWRTVDRARYTLRYPVRDSAVATTIAGYVDAGMTRAEDALRARYAQRFQTTLLPSRAALTAHWRAAWSQPSLTTQCWMIAAGWASELAMLSPSAWGSDACGHDAADAAHVRYVVHHELVHVLHAQTNARYLALQSSAPWLVEGIAVAASGQWDGEYRAQAQRAVHDAPPRSMSEAWAGSAAYPLAGALVAFAEATRGAGTTARLAAAGSWADALGILGGDEAAVLDAMTRWLRALP